jgi:hypothetical protein
MASRGSSVLSSTACPHALPEGEKEGWEMLEVGLNLVAYSDKRERERVRITNCSTMS